MDIYIIYTSRTNRRQKKVNQGTKKPRNVLLDLDRSTIRRRDTLIDRHFRSHEHRNL